MVDIHAKPDEHYLDGKDKWTVHYSMSDDTRVQPGDYNEIVQFIKNGTILGKTTWHKDKNGKDKTKPYEEGLTQVPSTAKKVKK